MSVGAILVDRQLAGSSALAHDSVPVPRARDHRRRESPSTALASLHLFNVNYFCRLASIILAGSPPYPAPAAGPLRSGSWGR